MPLRYRFIISFTILIFFLMAFVIIIVEKRQRDTFFAGARMRGESIARNLAAVSITPLVTYDYVILKQDAERVADETDIAYVIILDKEGSVAAYSGHDERQGVKLIDPVSLKASRAEAPLLQETFYKEKGLRVLDIAVPVFIGGSAERWGIIRLGLSLEDMYRDIQYTRNILLLIGFIAILSGYGGAVFLSRRITRPLEDLVGGTIKVARGNLKYRLNIETGDEIEELSHNFNYMVEEILAQQSELEAGYREIASLKRYNDYILASMTEGLFTVDRAGWLISINKKGELLIGVEGKDIIGKSYNECFGSSSLLANTLKQALTEGKTYKGLKLNFERGSESLLLAFNITPLLDERGESIGILAVFDDLTELKAIEERMRHADRLAAVGKLAASFAHDIRNPLTAIKTFVQLMPERFDSESFRERFNTTVPREINRIMEIIENLLDLSRKPKLKFSTIDLNKVFKDSFELYAVEMEKRQIKYELSLAPNLPCILADPEYLKRAFSNLIVNALQAMPQGGSLCSSTAVEKYGDNGSSVLLTLRDTGLGMDEETAKNLFNPFYTTKEKGTGLGLVIVKRIIEEHKGGIEVSSIPNQGSTFKIIFPVVYPDNSP